KFAWVPVRVLEIGEGTPNGWKQPRRVHRRLAWHGHPQNLKVGSFRKNGQTVKASRSGVRKSRVVELSRTLSISKRPQLARAVGAIAPSLAPVRSLAACDSQPNFDDG